MSRTASILFVDDRRWCLGLIEAGGVSLECVDRDADEPFDQTAERVAQRLAEPTVASGELVLAPPAGWCLSGVVTTTGGRRWSREALMYELERQLPIVAENTVGDFLRGRAHAFGVVCETARLRPIIDACESHGIRIGALCPPAMLAMRERAAATDPARSEGLLWAGDDRLELVLAEAGVPTAWHVMGPTAEALLTRARMLAALRDKPTLRLTAHGLSDALLAETADREELTLLTPAEPVSLNEAATRAAHHLRRGQHPPLDLRRGALRAAQPYRRLRAPLTALVTAALGVALCLAGALLWGAAQYHQTAERLRDRQAAIYREAMPGREPPANGAQLTRQLRIEWQTLKAQDDAAPETRRSGSAFDLMRAVFVRLPEDIAYRLSDIRLTGDLVRLEGRAGSPAAADRLAEGLGRDVMLQVEMPPPRRASGQRGVRFIINARRQSRGQPADAAASNEQPASEGS